MMHYADRKTETLAGSAGTPDLWALYGNKQPGTDNGLFITGDTLSPAERLESHLVQFKKFTPNPSFV